MTIEGIEIQNVQPHEHTIIEPHKGLTVIQGTSHSGKSSIIRALKKLIENRPLGREGLFSWFADEKETMSIGMSFEEGTYVYREQSKSDNNYNTSESKKPLRAIRSDVPEEVQAITRMNAVNIQGQHDPYFMLQSTSGEVGRMFNEAVRLEIIDIVIGLARRLVDNINAERNAAQKQIIELEKDLSKYEGLDEVKTMTEEIEELHKFVHMNTDYRNKLISYTEEMELLEMDIGLTKEFLKLEGLHMELSIQSAFIKAIRTKREPLNSLIAEWTVTEARMAINKKWLEIEEYFIEIWGIAENVSKLRSNRSRLQRIVRDIKTIKDEIQAKTDALSDIKKQFHDMLRETKICPFCYSVIGDETIEHICERRGLK